VVLVLSIKHRTSERFVIVLIQQQYDRKQLHLLFGIIMYK